MEKVFLVDEDVDAIVPLKWSVYFVYQDVDYACLAHGRDQWLAFFEHGDERGKFRNYVGEWHIFKHDSARN